MKVAVIFAEGFEEIEALTPVDIFKRANVQIDKVGLTSLEVTSSHDVVIKMDRLFGDDLKTYDLIIIPGGMPGAKNLQMSEQVIEMVKYFNQKHKLIGAICAGPIVLEKANVIEGKTVTCYPGFQEQLTSANYQEALVQVDDNIITAKGPAAALAFGYTLLNKLGIDSHDIEEGMQYSYLMNTK